MQLVYLWVAEYKNIKNQGFNFSPDFKCEYNEKSNKLTIDNNEDYQSIFPSNIYNINVTAIVGENGSGKSSLLELLINTKYNFLKSFIKIIKTEETVFIYTNIKNLSIPEDKKFKLCKIENIPQKICSDNYFIYENSIYPKENGLFSTLKIDKIKNILYYIQRKESYQKEFGSYFNPDTIEIANKNIDYNNDNKWFSKIRDSLNNLATSLKSTKKIFIYKIYYYILTKIAQNSINSPAFTDLKTLEDMRQQIDKYLTKNINNDKKDELLKQLKKLLQYIEYITEIDDFDKYVEYSGNEFTYSFRVNENFIIKHFFIIKNLPECFQEDFIDTIKEIRYSDLSSGEKSILNIIFYVEKIIQNNVSEKYVFLLDEPDNELHPNWQKKLLYYLIETFKDRKQNIHFILTTHSPFLLSDLPKENIIFLEKGKQVYPNIETFGANIHTLLSHAFFMDKGLIGEFAKNKINEIINFSKKVEDENNKEKPNFNNLKENYENNKKIFWNIYSIIGEEYLKQVIKNHLIEIEKILLGKDKAKQQKIKRLQTELNKLQEESNDSVKI